MKQVFKGIGFGVTRNKYFNMPRSKRSSNDKITKLKSEIENMKKKRVWKKMIN